MRQRLAGIGCALLLASGCEIGSPRRPVPGALAAAAARQSSCEAICRQIPNNRRRRGGPRRRATRRSAMYRLAGMAVPVFPNHRVDRRHARHRDDKRARQPRSFVRRSRRARVVGSCERTGQGRCDISNHGVGVRVPWRRIRPAHLVSAPVIREPIPRTGPVVQCRECSVSYSR